MPRGGGLLSLPHELQVRVFAAVGTDPDTGVAVLGAAELAAATAAARELRPAAEDAARAALEGAGAPRIHRGETHVQLLRFVEASRCAIRRRSAGRRGGARGGGPR